MCSITHSATWLILLWVLGTFNLQRRQIRKKGKISEPVNSTHTSLSPTLTPPFLFAPLQLISQRKTILRYKKFWVGGRHLPPSSHTYGITEDAEGIFLLSESCFFSFLHCLSLTLFPSIVMMGIAQPNCLS